MGWFDAGTPRSPYCSTTIVDGKSYCLIVLPESCTHKDGLSYSRLTQGMADCPQYPLLFDLRQVEKFDSTLPSFLCAIIGTERTSRPAFLYRGMSSDIRNLFDTWGFSAFLWEHLRPFSSSSKNLETTLADDVRQKVA